MFGILKEDRHAEEKEKIFSEIFGKIEFDDKKLRYLYTDLTALAEEFISVLGFLKENKLKQNILARELSERNCEKSYNTIYRHHREEKENEGIRDAEFYYFRYYFEHTHLSLEIARQKRKESTNIESVLDNLDKFYLARKLQLCCEVYNVKNVLSINYKAFLLDEILLYLSKNKYEDTPAIIVYYQILMTLLESENEKHFVKLRKLLLEYEGGFSKQELREMYQYVLNYCIKKINLGNLDYQKELFETYKIIIGNEVILLGKYFSQWDFKNIVTISCRLKEFGWAENFIRSNKEKLKTEERENAFIYNLAYLNFQNGNFSVARNLLQKVEFTDLYYQLDTKVILLKILYEQQDDDGFEYHTSAFKIYLKRNKLISDYQREIYLNLIKYTNRLLKAGSNDKKLKELKVEIEGNRQVADLQWLLKKVGEAETGK
ncbi:MAG: hypothetical protein IAF38_02515 [Bacteroidia bacterium]|nr:hypothetical protein [Bacteroidia bacterium]